MYRIQKIDRIHYWDFFNCLPLKIQLPGYVPNHLLYLSHQTASLRFSKIMKAHSVLAHLITIYLQDCWVLLPSPEK